MLCSQHGPYESPRAVWPVGCTPRFAHVILRLQSAAKRYGKTVTIGGLHNLFTLGFSGVTDVCSALYGFITLDTLTWDCPLTRARSSSNSRHPAPSSRSKSTQPLHRTHTPFMINALRRCTCFARVLHCSFCQLFHKQVILHRWNVRALISQ